jgi:serine phosphatase RsbU (regulator of sigma subunit)/pSer/pThr/pTyr-binding forkhead associated (FHA) protein
VLSAYLSAESDPRGATRVAAGESFIVGRTSDCGFVISDPSASRHHMEILADETGYRWRDLDSTNGVFINEEKRTEGALSPGDRIRIGETVLVFDVRDADPLADPDAGPLAENLVERLSHSGDAAGPHEADVLLEAVYAVMNAVASDYEPCSLVSRILQTTMKAIGGQRGAIFFAGKDDELGPCPVCGHVHLIEDGEMRHAEPGAIRISGTVARRVLRGGESVLVRDLGDETRLETTASVIALELRSIICAPLRGKYGNLGILYIDTNRSGDPYTQAHLLLSTAVGNSAGLALENARMHQEILQKQRTDQEIEFAANIQEGFLVRVWPQDDLRYSVYAETRPAKIIGGDFYDCVRLASGRLGLLVGDVSGKGVPAALTMAQVLAEFRTHAVQDLTALDLIRELNLSQCLRTQRGVFCTLLYAVFDPATGEVVCVNAGHHPALCVRKHGSDMLGPPTGPPIGIFADATWEESAFHLDPGDAIYLYTDGIVEARAASTSHGAGKLPEEYGLNSLRLLTEDFRGEPPDVVVREVLRDVFRFSEPLTPHDDCTLLSLRYLG